jgi:Big-like domain-containing protein
MTFTSTQSRGFSSISSALLAALAAGSIAYGCGGGGSDCGGPFCVPLGAPEATRIKADSGDGQTGAPGRALPQPVIVVATDNEDRPIADVEVTFTVGPGGGSISESAVHSDIDGKARVSWTLGTEPGAQTLQASARAKSGSLLDGAPLTLSAQAVRPPPARVVLLSPPSGTAQNGVPFVQQPVVEVLDEDDLPIPQVQVIASIASGGGTLSGTATIASDVAGRASYTDLAILGTKGPRTLKFSVADPAREVSSGTIQLDAGTASTLEGVRPLVYQGTVSSPVSPAPSVVAKDAAGNPVPGVAVTFTPNRDASVAPATVVTDQNGVAQVTSWTLGAGADGEFSLSAGVASTAIPPVVFSATAKAGAAGGLRVTTQPPSSAQSGTPLAPQPVIQVVDRNGNPASQAGVRVTATVSSGSGTLDHVSATTDASGQAQFTGLTLTGMIGSYIISFSAPDLAGVASGAIALTAGPPTKLALASALPAARSQQPLSPQPSVQVQDASGNPVAQAAVSVTATLTGNGTLGGTATATTDANGVATFTDLAITGAPGPLTLSFGSPVLGSASVAIVLPGVASIVVQPTPSSAVVGSMLTNVPSWILKDGAGQPVADVVVNLSASAGSVVPPSATSDINGLVQVQSWTLGPVAGDQVVVAAVTGTDLTDTVHLLATPDVPAKLSIISGNNQHGPVNDTLTDFLVVQLTDGFNNGIDGVEVVWRACEGGEVYTDTTSSQGYSTALQPTGPTAGTFCTRASASGLSAEFAYTVDPAGTAPSQSRSSERSAVKPRGLPPVAPPRTSVVRPYSR